MVGSAAIVTVRRQSTRFPDKCLKKIHGTTTIGIVLERAKQTKLPVILATCRGLENEVLKEQAERHDVEWFQGTSLNKFILWRDCFQQFGLTNGILVDGDDLCWDYEIGVRSLESISNGVDMVENPHDIVCGLFTKTVDVTLWNKLDKFLHDPDLDTDVATKFIESSDVSSIKIKLKEWERNRNYRLTLDYVEDFNMLSTLYSHLSFVSSGKEIIDFLDMHQDISKINMHRQKDYIENQKQFNRKVSI